MKNTKYVSPIKERVMLKQLEMIFCQLLLECSLRFETLPITIMQGRDSSAREWLIQHCLRWIRVVGNRVIVSHRVIGCRKLSDSEIASLVGVCRTTVLRIRNSL